MTGAFLNAIGILLGGLFGLVQRRPLSARAQFFLRNALGALVFVAGLRLVWLNINGTFPSVLKQLFLAVVALTLGYWLGKLLGLQKISNRAGHYANGLISSAPANTRHRASAGFNACIILFCAAPLGWVGAIADGLSGYFLLLAIKGLMDGLAMSSFVKMFRWPAALSAIPVYAFLGITSVASHSCANSLLNPPGMIDSVNAVAGLIACTVALVIFAVRRVELANFLPALAIAPLLVAWLG